MIINSSEPAKPSYPPTAVYDGCPHFGLANDPGTRLLFPADFAVCHLSRPVREIDAAYQQTTCLTAGHQSCVVFLRQKQGPLPPEISDMEGQNTRSHRVLLGVIVILLFAVVGVWVGLWWVNGGGQMAALPPVTSEEAAYGLVAQPTAVPTTPVPATATDIATAVPPTLTASATNTPSPTQTAPPPPPPTATLPPTFTPLSIIVLPPPTAVPTVQASVNVSRLNVRQGPGVAYDALALVAEGEQFTVIGRVSDGSWLQICCIAGASGWVIAESVLVTGDATAVPLITDIPPPPTVSP